MYDWNHVGLLLHVVEKLQGHPHLKHMQAAALKELAELKPHWRQNEEPPNEPINEDPPPPLPNQIPEKTEGEAEGLKRRPIGDNNG